MITITLITRWQWLLAYEQGDDCLELAIKGASHEN